MEHRVSRAAERRTFWLPPRTEFTDHATSPQVLERKRGPAQALASLASRPGRPNPFEVTGTLVERDVIFHARRNTALSAASGRDHVRHRLCHGNLEHETWNLEPETKEGPAQALASLASRPCLAESIQAAGTPFEWDVILHARRNAAPSAASGRDHVDLSNMPRELGTRNLKPGTWSLKPKKVPPRHLPPSPGPSPGWIYQPTLGPRRTRLSWFTRGGTPQLSAASGRDGD